MSTAVQPIQLKEKIDLTDTEEQIIRMLSSTIDYFGLTTVPRIAGGWVRDKLLGQDCADIDIAVDNMLGSEFAYKVQAYLESTGENVKVAVIHRNSDKSKHLETATMRLPVKGQSPVHTVSLDFVNLRHEIEAYSDNNRIPKTNEIGTLEQDAYRRDLTINSLFYNIKNRSVEDPTGRGISDLKSGNIVTPLAARTTFLDDPLRVLRAIRFGARFEFSLDEELKVAAACDEVKAALENKEKISRERIGAEIDLMMSCNQPVKAMKYMSDLTLFRVIFSVPAEFEPRLSIAYLDATWTFIQSIDSYTFDIDQRRLFLYAALFLPLRETTFMDQMGKKIPFVNHIFRESLKQKDNDAKTVVKIHRSLEKFLSLIPPLLNNEDISLDEYMRVAELTDISINSKLRVTTGFLLREVKEFWPAALWLSLLIYSSDIDGFINNEVDLAKKIDLYKAIKNRIVELGLEKVWDIKNLVKGDKIMNVLQPIARKELIGVWAHEALAWQLAHPSGNADACLEWIRHTNSKRPRMGIGGVKTGRPSPTGSSLRA